MAIERAACLSGCAEGLMAMVETPEGMARLRQVAQAADVEAALQGADALVVGEPVPALQGRVVSRVCWAEWDAE